MAKESKWLFEERVSKDGKPYRTYMKDGKGNKIPAGTPEKEIAALKALKKDPKEARKGKWAFEDRTSKDGKSYRFYFKDAAGKRIPIDTPADKLKELIAEKKTKKSAQWLYREAVTADGKKYQTFLKDADGNRIPADTPPEKVEEILKAKEAKKASRKEGSAKKATKTKAARANHKKMKKAIPEHIVNTWIANMATGKTIRGTVEDGNDSYTVVLRNQNWLLIHYTKKNHDKWIFFDPVADDIRKFDPAVDKTGPGDQGVVWPDGLPSLPPANATPPVEEDIALKI